VEGNTPRRTGNAGGNGERGEEKGGEVDGGRGSEGL